VHSVVAVYSEICEAHYLSLSDLLCHPLTTHPPTRVVAALPLQPGALVRLAREGDLWLWPRAQGRVQRLLCVGVPPPPYARYAPPPPYARYARNPQPTLRTETLNPKTLIPDDRNPDSPGDHQQLVTIPN
jgi:hypothetical protein